MPISYRLNRSYNFILDQLCFFRTAESAETNKHIITSGSLWMVTDCNHPKAPTYSVQSKIKKCRNGNL